MPDYYIPVLICRDVKHISGCKFNCYFIMTRCMCVQNVRVISAFLHIFRTITKTFTPVKIITDIYTAAQ